MNVARPPYISQTIRSPLISPGASPSLPSRRILVVATLDAERYTTVDITDSTESGQVIRARILNKLGVWDATEQTRSLIYETEIGAGAIGPPLTDDALSSMCCERGDSRASLAFIVQRSSPRRQSSEEQLSPRSPDYYADSDVPNHPTKNSNHTHQPQRYLGPPENSQATMSDNNQVSRLQLRQHHVARPHEIMIEGHGSGGNSDGAPPRRAVRPLPAIPTPTPSPSPGPPLSGGSYPQVSPVVNGIDHLYDYVPQQGSEAQQTHPIDPVGLTKTNNTKTNSNSQPSEDSLGRLNISDQSTLRSSETSPPPTISSAWRRGTLIGHGSSGPVYLALDLNTGAILAVKQIAMMRSRIQSRMIVAAFKEESQILRDLDHENIVKYLHLEETSTTLNIFMEYVPGGTITSCLKEFKRFSDNITKHFTRQILNGLGYLHSKHLLHRDLKSSNILVDFDGTCKIKEFGVSKYADHHGQVFTALQGSVFWMAPEVINTREKGYNAKVDIWSLGGLVLEMWTGVRPWDGVEAMDVMTKLYSERLPPPLPRTLSLTKFGQDFYDKCFTIDPDRRPSATRLLNHPYLVLPLGWTFRGFEHDDVNHESVPLPPSGALASFRLIQGLSSFHRYSSISETPAEWLHANRAQTKEILEFNVDFADLAECKAWTSSNMLYERLIMFIREIHPDQVHDLRNHITTWGKWDIFTSLHKSRSIGAHLHRFHVDLPVTDELERVVALDIDAICARLFLISKEPEQYKKLLSLQDDEAQAMLDLLQTLLDLPSLDAIFRSPFMNALLRLSSKSGLYPKILVQKQVILDGEDALTAGQFGDVWKGSFGGQQVAVKVLKLYITSDLSQHFKRVLQETLIWRQLRHINVLPFLCLHHVKNNRARIGLVSPWMDNGNAQEFLRCVSDVDRMSLVLDIAEGLDYLHSMQPRIIHGDLKAVNILITDARRACLADFGLSTASDSQVLHLSSFSTRHTGGTPRWTSPELLDGTKLVNDTKSDVYSFACVCYEVFSGNVPFHDINGDYPVILKVIRGQRSPRPSCCEPWKVDCISLGLDDETWAVIEECWKAEPEERPSVKDVIKRLSPGVNLRRASNQTFRRLNDSQKTNSTGTPWDFLS